MDTILIVLAIILLLGVKVSFTYYQKPKPKNIYMEVEPIDIKTKYRIVNTNQTHIRLPGHTYYLLESTNALRSTWKKESGTWAIKDSEAIREFNEYLDNQKKKPIVVSEFEV